MRGTIVKLINIKNHHIETWFKKLNFTPKNSSDAIQKILELITPKKVTNPKENQPKGEENKHVVNDPKFKSFDGIIQGYPKKFRPRIVKQIHAMHLVMGNKDLKSSHGVLGAYVKFGTMDEARNYFNSLKKKTLGAFVNMMKGYLSEFDSFASRKTFTDMIKYHKAHDAIPEILDNTPAKLVTIKRLIFSHAVKVNLSSHMKMSLIRSYGHSGDLQSAIRIFKEIEHEELIPRSWNAMIEAYAINQHCEGALACLTEMQIMGFVPDSYTVSHLLVACNHGGFVKEGIEILRRMRSDFNISPDIKYHIATVVDMTGRIGDVEEAEFFVLKLIKELPSLTSDEKDMLWRNVATKSVKHRDYDVGLRVYERIKKKIAPDYKTQSSLLWYSGDFFGVIEAKLMYRKTNKTSGVGVSYLED